MTLLENGAEQQIKRPWLRSVFFHPLYWNSTGSGCSGDGLPSSQAMKCLEQMAWNLDARHLSPLLHLLSHNFRLCPSFSVGNVSHPFTFFMEGYCSSLKEEHHLQSATAQSNFGIAVAASDNAWSEFVLNASYGRQWRTR